MWPQPERAPDLPPKTHGCPIEIHMYICRYIRENPLYTKIHQVTCFAGLLEAFVDWSKFVEMT